MFSIKHPIEIMLAKPKQPNQIGFFKECLWKKKAIVSPSSNIEDAKSEKDKEICHDLDSQMPKTRHRVNLMRMKFKAFILLR